MAKAFQERVDHEADRPTIPAPHNPEVAAFEADIAERGEWSARLAALGARMGMSAPHHTERHIP